jgi:hypothetical protein
LNTGTSKLSIDGMNYQRREGGKPSRKLFSQVRMKSFEVEEEGIPFRILWHEGLASLIQVGKKGLWHLVHSGKGSKQFGQKKEGLKDWIVWLTIRKKSKFRFSLRFEIKRSPGFS